ncbi:WhiB family transcriptional regulator [Streptomyces albireticuli]|uniref:Transcriptional regulator WhiB n=2 Tax=Streptomyces albireticuli TaxID=1940 RepID=A0A2A2DCB1_9ACTN|nr:WhiB family transcriptional regulator [Streptomyces albireticuli]MCD9146105.1 WhiB family transcriptional regulator [Streptomyces albireticuli]MCD9166259.1 WhiB family transcriptional regulator [Streptomyces albireticuli]MCD9196584.1 WhiB family transcriptional regulator [Streptomyces albireticuli]PAU50118.1 hypothetical protein CK936_04275 [Streptomyces albireticuli]
MIFQDRDTLDSAPPFWDRLWRHRAACAGRDTRPFFSPDTSPLLKEALGTCLRCPVSTECLAFALDERIPYGIYGGARANWRRALLIRRPDVKSWSDLLANARAEHYRKNPHPRSGQR